MELKQKITKRLKTEIHRREKLLMDAILPSDIEERFKGIIHGLTMALEIVEDAK